MSSHHELWIAARAKMHLVESEIASMPRRPRARSDRRALLMARVMHRLSTVLLRAGARLQCYADRILARAHGGRWEGSVANPC